MSSSFMVSYRKWDSNSNSQMHLVVHHQCKNKCWLYLWILCNIASETLISSWTSPFISFLFANGTKSMLWMGNMSKCFTSASLFLFCLILYFLLLYCLTFFTILGNIIQLKYLSIISNICDSCISFRISLTLIVCSHMSKQCVLIHYHFLVLFSIFGCMLSNTQPVLPECLLIHLLIYCSSSLLYFAIYGPLRRTMDKNLSITTIGSR